MKRQLRKALAFGIAQLPISGVRKWLYAAVFGYRFGANSRLGRRTVICVDDFFCDAGTVISRGNLFNGPFSVRIGRRVFLGKDNMFLAGEAIADASQAANSYARELVLGDGALVNHGHIFDVIGRIEIGAGTWIAGFRSQLLTHGASVHDRDIVIGPRCFIGSQVLMAPGSAIGADCIVAMGSVVTKKIAGDGLILSGVPARIARERQPDDVHAWERTW